MTRSVGSCRCFHFSEYFFICMIESQLMTLNIPTLRLNIQRRNRIFYNCIQQCIRQIHSPVIHQIMKLRYQAKRLCISLKMIQILPHLRGQDFIQRFTMIFQCMKMISEPLPDRIFTKMSKRRITNVMDQSRTL